RRTLGPAPQGRRSDTLFAHGRWTRGTALVDPRVSRLRSTECPEHPDYPRPVRDRLRHPGVAREAGTRGHGPAPGAEPCAFRAFRIFLLHQTPREAERTRRARIGHAFPRVPGTTGTVSGDVPRNR